MARDMHTPPSRRDRPGSRAAPPRPPSPRPQSPRAPPAKQTESQQKGS